MRYHLITLAIFALAAILMLLGTGENLGLVVLAACLTELVGWKRALSKRKCA